MKAKFPENQVIFEFEGLWGIPSKCGLHIKERGNCQIVIVTELYKENPGSSIAQVSTKLAMQICATYGLDYHRLVYIERNPDMHSKLSFYSEELFLVRFQITQSELLNPSWERLSAEQLRQYVEYVLC